MKVTYSAEELAARVKVPAVVEQDLKRIISDRLEQCGMYFRVFSRTKTAASMELKFQRKEYGEERKLQDLVGCRINLYFDDDVEICKSIMENTFSVLEWSTSARAEDEFKPTKLNGVFRLPEYLRSEISPATWDMCIDDTFEIQIKTMFFEGWHEIEHDMRYKGEELWKERSSFSRYFNSILATLELCDKSMVTLFEDLGHELYKSGNWSDMIRSHFRLKMGNVYLYPEVEQRLTEDQAETVDSLAKRIYKTPRSVLMEQFLSRNRKVPINANTIVAVLNDTLFHDQKLTEIFRARDVYNDGREESVGESRHHIPRPLTEYNVFGVRTWVNGCRMRGVETAGAGDIFNRCSELVHNWMRGKYATLFQDIPEQPASFVRDIAGYRVIEQYDAQQLSMGMEIRFLDVEVGGRIWYTRVRISPDETGKIWLQCCSGYAEPEREDFVSENGVVFFSYPGYYKQIVDSVGIYNGTECQSRRRILHQEQLESIADAIQDSERTFPIVLIISPSTKEGMMDESWLGQLRVSDFTRTVWRYAHVFTCYEQQGRSILAQLGEDTARAEIPGLWMFWPDGSVNSYGPEDVQNCSFGRHLEMRDDSRTYDIVHGGQAFYHQLVTDLREYNIAASKEIGCTSFSFSMN